MSVFFQFLDDVACADLAFDAEGDSAEEVVQAATNAVIESLANPTTVGQIWTRSIERQDADLSELLFDWLSDLVYWKDAAGVVFNQAPVELTADVDRWHLKATLIGAPVTQGTQELHHDVKGVTKHLYRLHQENGRWNVRVVLDV